MPSPVSGFSRFLGRFGGTGGAEAVSKTFALNPSIGRTTIDFDFNKIDSWDAYDRDSTPGDEKLAVFIDGVQAFTFMPHGFGQGLSDAGGSFEVNGVRGTYTVTSPGADRELGFAPYWDGADRIYRIRIELDGTGSSVKLGFGSTLDEVVDNESFGIDNVRVAQFGALDNFEDGSASGWTLNGAAAPVSGEARLTERVLPDREAFVYDGMGRVIASTDLNGGATSFVFRDASNQTIVTLSNGFVQTSTFNKAGELISHTESGDFVAARSDSYKYDQLGRLRMETDATGRNSYCVYDKVGRKVAYVGHYGQLTEYRYDSNDRLVATTVYGNVLSAAQLATLADPNSNVEMASIRPAASSIDIWSWTVYDREGRAIQTIDGTGLVTINDYDAAGRLVRSTDHVYALGYWDLEALKTTPPTAPVLPYKDTENDIVARNFYDKDGLLIAVLDGLGYLTRFVYDGAGRKVQEIAYFEATHAPHRASGTYEQLLSSVVGHPNDRSTRYVYDGQGLLRYVIDALNRVTEFGSTSSANGVVRQTIQYSGTIPTLASYTYTSVRDAIAAAGLAGNAANRVNHNVYDSSNRLAFSIDAEGRTIRIVRWSDPIAVDDRADIYAVNRLAP